MCASAAPDHVEAIDGITKEGEFGISLRPLPPRRIGAARKETVAIADIEIESWTIEDL